MEFLIHRNLEHKTIKDKALKVKYLTYFPTNISCYVRAFLINKINKIRFPLSL